MRQTNMIRLESLLIRPFKFTLVALTLTFACSTNAQSITTLECAVYKKVCMDEGGVETCDKNIDRDDHIVVVKRTGDTYDLDDITGIPELSFKSCKIKAGNLVCEESIGTHDTPRTTRSLVFGIIDGLGSYARISRASKYDGRLFGRVSCRRRTDGAKLF